MISELPLLAAWCYALAAIAFFLFGAYVAAAQRGHGAARNLLFALMASFVWSVASAIRSLDVPGGQFAAEALGVARDGAWLWFVVQLIQQVDSSDKRWPVRLTGLLVAARLGTFLLAALTSGSVAMYVQMAIFMQLIAAIFTLVLVEQLYRTLPAESRWGLKPFCLALGATAAFDLYLFADAYLFGRLDPDAWSLRGLAHAAVLPLVAVSAARVPGWAVRISVSRDLAFRSTALAASGLYLLMVAAAGYYVRYFGGDWGRALQVGLLFVALLGFGVVVFSGAQRARLRVFINKHLFPYRYDYRSEWLKFTRALESVDRRSDLGQVTIQALADLVESAGGALWFDDGEGHYRVRARLNMADFEADVALNDPVCELIGKDGWVLNLDDFRMRRQSYGDFQPPSWLYDINDAWLVVPLISADALIGFVVLLSPRTPFDVNWEVLDLLKTAQRQAASYLGRMQAAEALIEARKFDAFNRMSAFVVHDLKNLVAQLSLMMRNAERYKDNPEFQQDMLETVAHVEKKMRDLMLQLQNKTAIDRDRPVELGELLRKIKQGKAHAQPVVTIDDSSAPCWVRANPERLERVVGHIVQNALDATNDNGMVAARLRRVDARRACIEVTDTGCGMSSDFIRDQLFKPFQTTKSSGMGIGVFEARQYVRELGGDILVHSEQGRGTTMEVLLPLAVQLET